MIHNTVIIFTIYNLDYIWIASKHSIMEATGNQSNTEPYQAKGGGDHSEDSKPHPNIPF
jgi:hypothetical protein